MTFHCPVLLAATEFTQTSDQLEEVLIYSSAAGHRVVEDFVSFETFEHDLDGNMTKRTLVAGGEEVSYEWTDFDRLKRVESNQTGRMQDARYDVNGLRVQKLDKNGNSSREYGVGISASASVPASSTSTVPSISYIQGHQLLGAEVNGNLQFWLTDALGTVRDVVDDSGDVIQSYEFNEHGIPMPGSGASSGTFAPKTYQGALSVNDDRNDSGLYLMGHRHFDSTLGRFISRDPIGFAGGLNLFNGHSTNPVTYTDPTGLDPSCPSIYYAKTGIPTPNVPITRGEIEVYVQGTVTVLFIAEVGPMAVWQGGRLLFGAGARRAGAAMMAAGESGAPWAGAAAGAAAAAQAASKPCQPPRGNFGLGDLSAGEIAQIQRAVNTAGQPLRIFGSTARGTRGPLSDVDYLVPSSEAGLWAGMRLPGTPASITTSNTSPSGWGPMIEFRPNMPPRMIDP